MARPGSLPVVVAGAYGGVMFADTLAIGGGTILLILLIVVVVVLLRR